MSSELGNDIHCKLDFWNGAYRVLEKSYSDKEFHEKFKSGDIPLEYHLVSGGPHEFRAQYPAAFNRGTETYETDSQTTHNAAIFIRASNEAGSA